MLRKRIKSATRSNAAQWTLLLIAQALMFGLAGVSAFMLRFDFHMPSMFMRHMVYAIPVWIIVKSIAFQIANLNRRGLRYVSIGDVYRLLIANAAGSAVSCALILVFAPGGFPRSIYLSDLILSILSTTGLRVVVRLVVEAMQAGEPATQQKRTLIYGAGDAGIALLREVRNNPRLAYYVCGFLDDDG